MARYSSAYSKFIGRLKEIEALLLIARRLSTTFSIQSSPTYINALCRGGVVLLCSHLEGYIEDLGTLAIERIELNLLAKKSMSSGFRYHLSRDMIDDFSKMTDPTRIAKKIDDFLVRDGHIWDSSSNFVAPLPPQVFVSNFATPRHEDIRRFFARFGFQDFQRSLARRLQGNYDVCRNMVDNIVDQRNKIAHGDQLTAGTPTDLQDMLKYLRLYCRNLDSIVADWFKGKGCPIR